MLRAGQYNVRIPEEVRHFSLLQNVQTGSWGFTAFSVQLVLEFFPWEKAAGAPGDYLPTF